MIYIAVHDELDKEYVIAARLDGASNLNILIHTVLPNISAVTVTELTRALSIAIIDIAALGFLELGHSCRPLNGGDARGFSGTDLCRALDRTSAGTAILISVLLVNLLGTGLQRAINAGLNNAVTGYPQFNH